MTTQRHANYKQNYTAINYRRSQYIELYTASQSSHYIQRVHKEARQS